MPNFSPMTCRELVELVTEYLEGVLSQSDRARFESHIQECRHCAAYLEQIRLVAETLGRLTPEAIPARAAEDLLEAFRAWKKDPRVREL